MSGTDVLLKTTQIDDLNKNDTFLYEGKLYRVENFYRILVGCRDIEEYQYVEFSRHLIIRQLVFISRP